MIAAGARTRTTMMARPIVFRPPPRSNFDGHVKYRAAVRAVEPETKCSMSRSCFAWPRRLFRMSLS